MAARKPSLAELQVVAEHAALRVAIYRRRTCLGARRAAAPGRARAHRQGRG
jgi:hypothetical protein